MLKIAILGIPSEIIFSSAHFHRFFSPSFCILDYKAARTKAAVAVFKEAKRILLLSGTPALSRPKELYSQINLVDPKLFPYMTDFGMRYCDGRKVSFGPKVHYDFKVIFESLSQRETKRVFRQAGITRLIFATSSTNVPKN